MPLNVVPATYTVASIAESESPTIGSDNTNVTSIEPRSSGSDSNNTIPLIAGVIAGIIVLLGTAIVLVVVILLIKTRYTFN